MKNWILFTLIIVSFSCPAQKKEQPYVIRNDKKITLPQPPNCIHLYDSLFIDETEIANLNWLEYLLAIKNDSSVAFHLSQIPDTTINYSKTYGQLLLHPFFRMYPVIGASYEQVKSYCKWRSKVVTIAYENMHNRNKKYKFIFEFKLPTIKEWEYAALGGENYNVYPNGIRETLKKVKKESVKNEFNRSGIQIDSLNWLFKDNKVYLLNANVYEDFYSIKDSKYYHIDNKFQINEIYYHVPNSFNLNEIIGNVAEMTEEKGIAKGGSYKDRITSFNIKTNFAYTKPENWLGFRCVCIVHVIEK